VKRGTIEKAKKVRSEKKQEHDIPYTTSKYGCTFYGGVGAEERSDRKKGGERIVRLVTCGIEDCGLRDKRKSALVT